MTQLTNIREALKLETMERIEETQKAIAESETALRNHSTATRWEQYEHNAITRLQAEGYATNRMKKAAVKAYSAKLARIVEAEKTEVKSASISIIVEYKRNRTWGYNPTASVTIAAETANGYKTERTTGTASGCGYDKTSAAVASALNDSAIIRADLIRAKDARLAHDEAMPYGSGHGAMPYIKGATGMSTLEAVLNACGYRLTIRDETENTRIYCFEKRENSAQED